MAQTEQFKKNLTQRGVLTALGAALLFGAGLPLAKVLLRDVSPWMMAALLYLGSGIGLALYRLPQKLTLPRLRQGEWFWLAAAIFAGGVLGPGLLMLGLTSMPASGASLLLNAEGVFTTLLAWFVFRENFDRRIALGMIAILAGLAVMSWPSGAKFAGVAPALCLLGACFCWAVDNNLTRKVSLCDATCLASLKGLTAGSVNLALALALGAKWPTPPQIAASMLIGLFAYGFSLVLFVVGLRSLGTARTGAYFSVAPFLGAVLSVALLHEPMAPRLFVAGILMAIGLWLHLTESHSHEHDHACVGHEHAHEHDAHHQHEHPSAADLCSAHVHPHEHEPLVHAHEHYPDSHHQHS